MGVSSLLYGLMAQGEPKETLTTEAKIVAITILAEARGEGKMGMYAVGAVIAQRALERDQTVTEVCKAPKQFSCWNGKAVNDFKHLLDLPEARYAILVAKNIHNLDHKIVGNANHYHSNRMKKFPYWTKGKRPTVTIKGHIFYKL